MKTWLATMALAVFGICVGVGDAYAIDPFVPESDYFHRVNPWPLTAGTSALFSNPAALAQSRHQALRFQTNESWLGYSQYEAQGLLATDIAALSLGGLVWTASDIPMVSRGENGRPQIDGQAQHQMASLSVASGFQIVPSISAGISAVYQAQNLAGAMSQGYGGDIGILATVLPGIQVGLYTYNLFHSGLTWSGSTLKEPFQRYLGTSAEVVAGPFKFGVLGLGSLARVIGQWRPVQQWSLWLGSSTLDTRRIRLDYWSVGTELAVEGMTFQYQYQVSNQPSLVAAQHSFSTTFVLGDVLQISPPATRPHAPTIVWVPLSGHHDFPFESELADAVTKAGFVVRPADVLLNYRQARELSWETFYQPQTLLQAAEDLGITALIYWDWIRWIQFRELHFRLLYAPSKTWYSAALKRDDDDDERHLFFHSTFENLYKKWP